MYNLLATNVWDTVVNGVEKVNAWVNNVVWGWPMIVLILGVGIFLTVMTKFLQVRKFGTSINETIVPTVKSIGKKRVKKTENSVSPFEAFATAISGTVGTGNIIGVTSAIMTGGPGAVVWMWISAFFGMVTNYAENVLGMYFRKKENGDFSGGPAYYLSEGIGRNTKGKLGSFLRGLGKTLGVLAAVFCTLAAIGMSGVQTNKISSTYQDIFTSMGANSTVIAVIVGVVVAAMLALIILFGIKGIGKTTSILVPFMSLIFIVMAFVVIFANIQMVGPAFALIFKNMFSFRSAIGGFSGYLFAQVIRRGLARGIFSNEAGLGSSVIAHSASETREPVKQGLWGIFEVFFDTFVICTLTALVVLVCFGDQVGMETVLYRFNADGSLYYTDTAVSMMAFQDTFKTFGTVVYAVIIPLFAFTTILAWSYYGEKSVDFLFRKTGNTGRKIAKLVFKILYVLLVIVAALLGGERGELVWAISDTCNGLMALPNLIGLIFLGSLVVKITKNYFDRKKGKDVLPMLSVYPEQNEEFIAELAFKEDAAETEEKTPTVENS